MTTQSERQARASVFALWADWASGEGDQPTVPAMERIVSTYGLYPADTYAYEYGREALLMYLGVAWGVGPKARWTDRLRVWWACRRG